MNATPQAAEFIKMILFWVIKLKPILFGKIQMLNIFEMFLVLGTNMLFAAAWQRNFYPAGVKNKVN